MDHPVPNLLAEYSGYNQQKMPSLPMQSSKDILSVQSVQPIAEEKNTDDGLTVFFGIGMTINIIMIIVFVLWATKEWKKRDASEE